MKKALGAKAKIGGTAGEFQGKNGQQRAGAGRFAGRSRALGHFLLDLPRFGLARGGFWISFVRSSFAGSMVVNGCQWLSMVVNGCQWL